jgi:hypothetical protein
MSGFEWMSPVDLPYALRDTTAFDELAKKLGDRVGVPDRAEHDPGGAAIGSQKDHGAATKQPLQQRLLDADVLGAV